MLFRSPEGDPDLAAAVERRLPLVVVDEPRTGGHTFVGIDDRAGARLAAEHLAGLGHRRIAVVSFRTTDDGYSGILTPEREAASRDPDEPVSLEKSDDAGERRASAPATEAEAPAES